SIPFIPAPSSFFRISQDGLFTLNWIPASKEQQRGKKFSENCPCDAVIVLGGQFSSKSLCTSQNKCGSFFLYRSSRPETTGKRLESQQLVLLYARRRNLDG
ncbi:MAG: hypothetical protein L0K43_07250, partial [Bifidobacterium crudilactis]|nr:hypothetical protein [Bifidobacterium crudilactis]